MTEPFIFRTPAVPDDEVLETPQVNNMHLVAYCAYRQFPQGHSLTHPCPMEI